MKIGIANFYDQSRMINYEASDYEKYADELKHLRDQLGEMETLKQSVTELEKRVREKEPGENSAVASGQRSEFPDGHLFRPGQRGAVRVFKGLCSLGPAILHQQSVSF